MENPNEAKNVLDEQSKKIEKIIEQIKNQNDNFCLLLKANGAEEEDFKDCEKEKEAFGKKIANAVADYKNAVKYLAD